MRDPITGSRTLGLGFDANGEVARPARLEYMSFMFGSRPIGLVAFAVLALMSAAAVAGWSAHGTSMVLSTAQSAWTTCF